MKTKILKLLLPVLAMAAAACGDSFEFGSPTHDLDEGIDLTAGTTQVLWKNKGAVYPTKRIHNFRIPGLVRTPHKLIAFCEAREETGSTNKDGGDIDLVYRVSTDDGQTWASSVRRRGQHLRKCLCGLYRKRASGDTLLLAAHRNYRS